ncbi:MAG: hypothetical protein IH626_22950 [Rhodospirillales bacterium]|nr:hypothetical protein [Rhodospirillales bacterium]
MMDAVALPLNDIPKPPIPRPTSDLVVEQLRRWMFQPREYVSAREFDPGTGTLSTGRRLDLFCIATAPSKRNCQRVGIEVKISRSDWLRELRTPEKRRVALRICNKFYIAAPVGVVKPEELPDGIGLIECPWDMIFFDRRRWGGKAEWVWDSPKQTVKAEWRDTPAPTWSLVASFGRRVADEKVSDKGEPS